MGLETLDYSAIVADLEAKKAALEVMITSARSAMAVGALGKTGDVPPAAGRSPLVPPAAFGPPVELPAGAFHGKSLGPAIKLYLAAIKKKQTIREISTALREGGVESTSENFESVVTGALNRLKGSHEVLRFKDGWGLAEFYPESLRARIGGIDKQPKKKRGARAKGKPARARIKLVESAEPQRIGPQKAIEDYVASQLGKCVTAAQVAGALQMRTQTVALILGKLAHTGHLGKNDDGSFNVGKPEETQLVN